MLSLKGFASFFIKRCGSGSTPSTKKNWFHNRLLLVVYTQFTVHARYFDRNQSFTRFKKYMKSRPKTLFQQNGKKRTPSTWKLSKSIFFWILSYKNKFLKMLNHLIQVGALRWVACKNLAYQFFSLQLLLYMVHLNHRANRENASLIFHDR